MENPMPVAPNLDPLRCSGLHHAFGAQRVLDGVSLKVPQGAVLGLVGRNGAGKSTLIRILLGLLRPGGGEAQVFGCPAAELDDACKQRLAYVPQQPEAFQWMKVGAMLDFVGSFYPRWDAGYAEAMLRRWSIRRDSLLSKLSPGERQGVALVRALATQPELLILDEPAAALDPVARRELLREIARRAGDSGCTVLFSTHIVSDLERVASQVALLHRGRLLLDAPVDDFKETHARLTLPTEAGLPRHLPGELSRRRHADGSVSLVLVRRADEPWLPAGLAPDAALEGLSVEELFVEAAE
jgi:ABC-2 type transport system ATP-binding protein